jgi:4-cresol dehydrogenase (hydroxylating)
VNPRSTLGLIEIFYDRDDEDERARMLALYDDLADASLAAGYQQYRSSVWYGERLLTASDGFRRLTETLKAAVDPEGVIAPGRYGIRSARA